MRAGQTRAPPARHRAPTWPSSCLPIRQRARPQGPPLQRCATMPSQERGLPPDGPRCRRAIAGRGPPTPRSPRGRADARLPGRSWWHPLGVRRGGTPRRAQRRGSSWWGGWHSPPGSRTAKHSTSSREREVWSRSSRGSLDGYLQRWCPRRDSNALLRCLNGLPQRFSRGSCGRRRRSRSWLAPARGGFKAPGQQEMTGGPAEGPPPWSPAVPPPSWRRVASTSWSDGSPPCSGRRT
jgi:hypothetical protein